MTHVLILVSAFLLKRVNWGVAGARAEEVLGDRFSLIRIFFESSKNIATCNNVNE